MDLDNPVIMLCAAGTQAEFQGRLADARALYFQAWADARDDYEACVAAHYIAHYITRCEDDAQAALRWNQEALTRADAVGDERVREFYPSLYVNLGQSYERLGNLAEARRFFARAAELGLVHQGMDPRTGS